MVLKYNYLISFEETIVGTVSTKSYSIANESKNCNFNIERHPIFDSTLNPFIVKKKSSKNATFEVVVTFCPTVPHQQNVSYFVLKNEEKSIVLCVKGECIGLSVKASVSKLVFYCLKDEKKTKATFELTNLSEIPIKFHFDIDNKQHLFHIDPVSGDISATKHIYINVTFVSDKSGVFYLPLACLILHHEPLIIELMAVNARDKNNEILQVFRQRPLPLQVESNYEKYHILNCPGPSVNSVCSMATKYLSFSKKYDKTVDSILLLEIRNNSDKFMQIKFDSDYDNTFIVQFPHIGLKPGQCAILDCEFKPAAEDRLYGSILYGRATTVDDDMDKRSLIDNEQLIFPLPLTLRTNGHSFSGLNSWFALVQMVTQDIVMPVAIPGETVYTTFHINRLGEFPVIYQFVRPAKTCFSILPLSGIIEGSFQIFVVRFATENPESRGYHETWQLQFNYSPDGAKDLCLRALVENPELLVGQRNTVAFGNIYPGCQECLTVPVRNVTQLSLRYNFFNNKWIEIEDNIGTIDNHETVKLKWTYSAALDVPESFDMKYELSVLQNGYLQIGAAVECSVTVLAQSSYAKLCATPSYNAFTELVSCEETLFSFNIFNFGQCEVNFKLKIIQNFDLPGVADITIVPDKATLSAQGNVRIDGVLLPRKSGPGHFCVKYYVTSSRECDSIIYMEDSIWPGTGILYKTEYYSGYPTLKIVDIGRNKAGPLFGKLNIWEIFNIEQLNVILKNIKANQTIDFDVYMPEAQADSDICKMFTFVVKNTSNVDTYCKLERKKYCACALKQIYTNTSVRKYTYEDCPHRKILDVTISDENIRAQDIQYIVIEVFYNLYGPQTMLYTMNLSHDRTIRLYFQVMGLEPASLSIYAKNFKFAMYNVYTGELDADLQIFWFYNNTRQPSPYLLDTEALHQINRHYRANVLTCFNPRDRVNSKTVHALIFKFSPVDADNFQIELPLYLGNTRSNFTISGQGTGNYRSPINKICGYGPGKEIYYHPGLLVHISTEHMTVAPIATYSSTTRIFCLKNATKDKDIAFCFESYYRRQIVYATVEPSTGLLKPKERIWLQMKLQTFGNACAIRVTCCCHLLDKTALFKYVECCTAYHKEATLLHQQFEITEKGTTYPKSTVKIDPQPKIFHRIVAISCHIVGTPDRDLKMSLYHQLKQTPEKSISLYTPDVLEKMLPRQQQHDTEPLEKPINTLYAKRVTRQLHSNQQQECHDQEDKCYQKEYSKFNDKVYSLIHIVLECVIYDVIYSRKFKHIVDSLQSLPNKYYSEFSNENFDADEKRTMTKAALNRVPNTVMSEVLQQLVYDSVKQHFKLCAPPMFDKHDEDTGRLKFGSVKSTSLNIEKFLFLFDDV